MSASVARPAQFSQPSRKGKKSWRKNIDVTEVETALDEVRQEIIQHGAPLASQAAEDIFVLDTVGDVHQRLAYQRENQLKKPLKADEIIARRSAVAGVDSRKRTASQVSTNRLPDSDSKRKRNSTATTVSRSHLERLREIAYSGSTGPKHEIGKADIHERAANDDLADPWAVSSVPPVSAAVTTTTTTTHEFIEKKAPVKAPSTITHAPIVLSTTGKRIPAVQRPDPGRSYNPLFTDWNDLVTREGQKEVEAETKRLAEADRLEQQQARVLASAAEAEAKDRDQDLYDDSEWEGFATEAEDESGGVGARSKQRKTKNKAERNKANRRKAAERQAIHDKKMATWEARLAESNSRSVAMVAEAAEARKKAKERKHGVKRVSSDGTDEVDVDGVEAETSADESELSEDGEDDKLRRRRLGSKTTIPAKPVELLLMDELQDSLRRLKPEGNILFDRYRSALVRGKVEVRTKFQHKKPRRKATEKWTYKDFKI